MDRPPETHDEDVARWLKKWGRPPDQPLPPDARLLLRKLRREQAEKQEARA